MVPLYHQCLMKKQLIWYALQQLILVAYRFYNTTKNPSPAFRIWSLWKQNLVHVSIKSSTTKKMFADAVFTEFKEMVYV